MSVPVSFFNYRLVSFRKKCFYHISRKFSFDFCSSFLCHFLHNSSINQHIIALSIHKTTDSDIFKFFSSFELKIRVFDQVYAFLIIWFAAVFPVLGFCKKIPIGYHLFVQNYHHMLKFEKTSRF